MHFEVEETRAQRGAISYQRSRTATEMRACNCRTRVLTPLLHPQAHIHLQERYRDISSEAWASTGHLHTHSWGPGVAGTQLGVLQSLLLSFPASLGLGSTGTSQAVAMATAGGPDAAEKVLWIPEGEVQSCGNQPFL